MGLVDQNFRIMKPTPDGYLYRLPSRWVLGRARHYLLNDTQRERLLAAIKDPHPVRTAVIAIAALAALIVLTVAIILAFGALTDPGYKGSGLAAGLVASVGVLAMLYGIAVLTARVMIRRVHAAVPDLAPTEQTFSNADLRAALDASMDPNVRLGLVLLLALGCLLMGVGVGIEAYDAGRVTLGAAARGLVVVSLGSVALIHLRSWLRSRRA